MDPNDEHAFCSGLYGELQDEGACGWYVERSHRALERKLGPLPTDARVLELGGNLGEHCRFVEHPYASYLVTDYREVDFVPSDPRISFQVADAQHLPYDDASFDRVLLTCVLHHLPDPERAMREMRRVTAPGGTISITLPCDPGMAYRLGKAVGPYRSIRKRGGTDPQYFHYHQHRNHYPGLVAALQQVYRDDQVTSTSWPLPLPTWNFNLFTIFQIRVAPTA